MTSETTGIPPQTTIEDSITGAADQSRSASGGELVPDGPPRADEGPVEVKRGRPRGFAAMDIL